MELGRPPLSFFSFFSELKDIRQVGKSSQAQGCRESME